MDPIEVGWKKQFPGEVQIYLDKPQPIQKSKNSEKKTNRRRAQFNCRVSCAKEEAIEERKYNPPGTVQSDKSTFDEYDLTSSSINILPTNEVSIVGHIPICGVRAIAIVLIIVILMILAGAIAISVGISKSKLQPGSSETRIGNNNQNSWSTLSTTVVRSSLSVGSQSGLPCTSYTTINDPTRNANRTGIYGTCDNGSPFNTNNGGSWIRFTGTGGTIISLTSPGVSRCGGYLSGWYNGTLPTTVGIVVNGTVCFDISSSSSSCGWSVPMSIINCSGFYVYFLPPVPSCDARYCTA